MQHPVKNLSTTGLPESGYIRLSELLQYIPISRASVWRLVRCGKFPQPLKLTERVTVWDVADIRRWINEKARSAST